MSKRIKKTEKLYKRVPFFYGPILVSTRMPTVSLPIGRTVNEAFSYFQHSYLSFEQGALCTTPQRLMKSLELVSLGEEVESNRNTSCALLITTLITSVKMNSGIAVAHCINRSYRSIQTDSS